MICPSCGQEIENDSRICETCGATIGERPSNSEAAPTHSNQQPGPGIVMGEDGVLRWVYEMNMWKNPTLIITIWKVFLLSSLAPALLMFFVSLGDGFGLAITLFLKIAGIAAGVVTGLMLLAYPLVAVINGGKYCVLFEMDDKSIKHIQMQKQFKKSQVLSMIVVLAGVMAGNVQTTAAGLMAGTKQSSVSSFKSVKNITVNRKRHVIYVNERLYRNQVYAAAGDFEFVCDFIIGHCEKAKVTYQ